MLDRIFTPFPTLTTERLILRQLSIDDDKEIFALRSDNKVNKYLDRQPSETIEDARRFINKVSQSIKKSDLIYWAITMADKNNLLGTICLFDFSDEKNKCEIGYELLPDFQGQGIMKEATSKIIEFGIRTVGLEEIEAFTHKDNQNSTKLLEKFGFKKSTEPDKTNPDYFIFTFKTSTGQY
ncbi:MAG: GNAT family N-acetyltransferase [Bacteroidetes bacterium]|nr:GNAT family N-acetyltransferase [Bacteroidota bacterium]